MPWEEELEELKQRRKLARAMGGPERVARQHTKGRLTVRERIDRLVDRNSFREIGTLAGNVEYDNKGKIADYVPSATITGHGRVDDRTVCIVGDDFTLRGGGADYSGGAKRSFLFDTAREWRVPLVSLLDSVGGSVAVLEKMGRSYIPINQGWATLSELMGQVPVVAAVLGSAGGWIAAMAAISHWSVMTKNSELFVAGPPLVKRALGIDISKEELGNYETHVYQSGAIDNLAEDEEDAFRQTKQFLSYLPQNVWHQPTRTETGDKPDRCEEDLLSIVPAEPRKIFKIRKLIDLIVDKDSMFEFAPYYGRSTVTVLARLDGFPVAVISNDSYWYGGAQDVAGAEKMTRFIDMADTFHIPIVYFVDVPGYMIGPEAERSGTLRKAARAHVALHQSTVPWATVLVRRCFGVAGAGHGNYARLNLRYAWPSGTWGSLPIAGGVMAAYRREIEESTDPAAKTAEIEERLKQIYSPFRTAEAFGPMEVEEIIDPRETRPLLCEFAHRAQEITATQLGPKSRGMRP